jgi:hypothetical protein
MAATFLMCESDMGGCNMLEKVLRIRKIIQYRSDRTYAPK